MKNSNSQCAATSAASTVIPDYHRVAIVLAERVAELKAENYELRRGNANLRNAVEQLLEENESVSNGFTIVLNALEAAHA